MKTFSWDEIMNSHGVPIYYSSKSEGNNDFEKKINFLNASDVKNIVVNYSDLFDGDTSNYKILLADLSDNQYSVMAYNEKGECIFDSWNETIENNHDNIINMMLDNKLIK